MDSTLQNIIEIALQQGIWAGLYIYLFFRMLKQNEEREAQYQSTIDKLSGNIQSGIENIQNRLNDLEEKMSDKPEKTRNRKAPSLCPSTSFWGHFAAEKEEGD